MKDFADLNIKVYWEEDGSYYAEIGAFPGCFSSGDTLEELEKNLSEALESHLLSLQKDVRDSKIQISSSDIVHA